MTEKDPFASVSCRSWLVDKTLTLEWYDGPREGVCRLADPICEFTFKMIAERYDPSGLDDRFYRLSKLPVGSIEVLESILSVDEQSTANTAEQGRQGNGGASSQESLVNKVIESALRTRWVLQSRDFVVFDHLWDIEDDIFDSDLIDRIERNLSKDSD